MPLIVSEFDAGAGTLRLIPLSQVRGRLASHKAEDRLKGNMPIKAAGVAEDERVEIGVDALATEP